MAVIATDQPDPPYRALVCDDDKDICTLAKVFLEGSGIKVDTVNFGEEALERLSRNNYDVLMLDLVMPGMSGIDVIRKIRTGHQNTKHLPVILVSGMDEEGIMLKGLEEGATDFLKKPFSPPELLARLRNHAAAKRMHDRLITVNQSLEAEREKIFQIQQSLLPKTLPDNEKLCVSAAYRPSSRAGGDFYDAIETDDGRLILAAGDVSGHGIPSAMHMSILRAVLHSEINFGRPINEILVSLNRVLYYGLDGWSFVTFYLAVLDPVTGNLEHCGAGHVPPILHDLGSGEVTELSLEPAHPLGIEPTFEARVSSHKLSPHQRILIYTDGLVEETHVDTGELFGRKRLMEEITTTADVPTADLPARLLKRLERFSGRSLPRDDVTMLLLELRG